MLQRNCKQVLETSDGKVLAKSKGMLKNRKNKNTYIGVEQACSEEGNARS